jgi:hypothetical protein
VLFAWVANCTLLVESLIAAVIWAFMWIRFDGEEFISDHAKQGAQLVFTLTLRPMLSTLAFCGVYYVLPLTMGFLNTTFAKNFVANTAGHVTGLATAIGGLGLLAYLQYQVVVRTCALIHQLPDRIIRWLGSHGEGLNEDMHAHGATTAMVSSIHQGAAEGKRAPTRPPGDDKDKKGPRPPSSGTKPSLPAGVSTINKPTSGKP